MVYGPFIPENTSGRKIKVRSIFFGFLTLTLELCTSYIFFYFYFTDRLTGPNCLMKKIRRPGNQLTKALGNIYMDVIKGYYQYIGLLAKKWYWPIPIYVGLFTRIVECLNPNESKTKILFYQVMTGNCCI